MQTLETDVVVVGSGLAGLTAALTAHQNGCQVLLVTDSPGWPASSRSGGNLRVSTADYTPEQHFLDTIAGGKFISQRSMVKAMAQEAPAGRAFLEGVGVKFREIATGVRVVSENRAPGGVLVSRVMASCEAVGIRRVGAMGWEVLLDASGAVRGLLAFDADRNEWLAIAARAIILATGGAASIYFRTDNSLAATGDGIAMAFRAGAVLADMEFVQFWPLAAVGPEVCSLLLPPDMTGKRLFVAGDHDITDRVGLSKLGTDGNTPDLVARRIYEAAVYGATSPDEELPLHLAAQAGAEDAVPVTPVAHHTMGGVVGGDHGQTRIAGLYAAGEVAAGMHGADRLSGNGLTEAVVMGRRAGILGAASAQSGDPSPSGSSGDWDRLVRDRVRRTLALLEGGESSSLKPVEAARRIRLVMWRCAALVRTRESLDSAQSTINKVKRAIPLSIDLGSGNEVRTALKTLNLVVIAEAVVRSARYRKESRGYHFRSDYPGSDDAEWLRHIKVRLLSGEMGLDVSQGLEIMEP